MWLPTSSILPSFITIILSQSLMVDNLCATTKEVLPWSNFSIPSCTNFSVSVSILDVASSNINIEGFDNTALAIANYWFSPALKLLPPSERTVSYPSGSLDMNLWALAIFAADIISKSVAASFPYIIFSFIVPENK